MATRALFITFEGLDGSGKSTQLERVGSWMEKRRLSYRMTREPGGAPLSDALRDLILDPRWTVDPRVESLLYFASRRQHLVEVIEPALAAGQHVLCDRFTDSSFAYQGAGRELGLDWVTDLDRLATGARRPDATLFLDVEPRIAFSRRRGGEEDLDRLDAEGLAFYERVDRAFRDLIASEPERFHRVDANGDLEATWSGVEKTLRRLFRPVEDNP